MKHASDGQVRIGIFRKFDQDSGQAQVQGVGAEQPMVLGDYLNL
jgi:hypothetical protein